MPSYSSYSSLKSTPLQPTAYITTLAPFRDFFRFDQLELAERLSDFHRLYHDECSSQAATALTSVPSPLSLEARRDENDRLKLVEFDQLNALYSRLARSSRIQTRTTCIADLMLDSQEERALFGRKGKVNPSTSQRMRIYEHVVERILFRMLDSTGLGGSAAEAETEAEAEPETKQDFGALMQVSCTGYVSPAAGQKWIAQQSTPMRYFHLGHMGCFAAIPALDLMAAWTSQHLQNATICLHELCSLHFQLQQPTIENIVSHTLFADGAIKLDISPARTASSSRASSPTKPRLALLDSFERVLPQTEDQMTWRIAETGFPMTLSKKVGTHFQAVLGGVVQEFLSAHGLYRSDIKHYAVHPGGIKILDATQAALELSNEHMRHSQAILAEHGNMSSATLPHTWERTLNDEQTLDGALMLSLAFGPGLTLTGNLMRIEKP